MQAAESSTAHESLLDKSARKLGLESAERHKYTLGIVCVLAMAVLVIAAILCAPAAFPLKPTQFKKKGTTAPNVCTVYIYMEFRDFF